MKKKTSHRSAFFNLRALVGALICFAGVALLLAAFSKISAQRDAESAAGKPPTSRAQYRGLMPVVHFDVSQPLRDIKPLPLGPATHPEEEDQEIIPRVKAAAKPVDDPVVQAWMGAKLPAISPPLVSFNGPPNVNGVSPPDPNGAVGPNHVVAIANLIFQIYTRTGTSVFGPAATNTLWSGFGGGCQTRNDGDPVVLYDHFADRWLITQFTSAAPYLQCVALSQTNDPTGAYYRWSFPVGGGNNFGDYPKVGMWPDAYYFSTREFQGGSTFVGCGAYAFNRAQAIAGNPNPTVISFLAPPTPMYQVGDGLLPSDLDGPTMPPAGTPNFFIGSEDDNGGYGAPSDALTVWKFHADFGTPANSTFTLTNTLAVAPFNSILALCGGGRACIPQPSTTNRLDHLGYRQRPTFRAAYRKFADHEAIVTNQSVSAGTGPSGEVSGVRWWELRALSTATPVVFQQGTYAPGLTDGIHRWMGSIALNGAGDMALGFSASNATTFPSVFYTARHPGDPAGQMPLGEGSIINGTGSQTGSNRWGDYTSMVIDPVDDMTFWYINEWVPTTSGVGWQLRVGSFNLVPTPNLTAGTATLTAESCTPANMALDPNETVTINFCVHNGGDASTTNTVGTLQASGGVANPSGPQNYGAIAAGATVCRPFTFRVNATCGQTVTASIQLQDGATNFGTVPYTFQTGTLNTSFSQNFDGVTPPTLPAGWTVDQGTNAGGSPLWVTSNSGTPTPVADTAPNSAYSQDPATLLDNRIYSPGVTYTAGSQLIFKQNYDLEENTTTTAYDAGVLEMNINGSGWQDILAAGGTFASGGYNHTALNTGFSNPLLADHCPGGSCGNWSGVSGGFVTTVVNLPAAGAGPTVQFRWRMGSDSSVSHTGWRIDTVSIAQRVCSTNCAPAVTSAVSRKTHGAAGAFDIALPLTGTTGVECRTGGATNDYTMVVTFAGNVTVTGSPQAQVTSGTGTIGSNGVSNGGNVTVAANVVTIPLTNVADQQTINVTLNGVNSAADEPAANIVIPMSRLLGDSNGNRSVNSGDILQVKQRIGQAVTATNFRSDLNFNGSINAGDVSVAKQNTGHAVP